VLPLDAMNRLRQRFPLAVSLLHEPPVALHGADRSYAERVRDRTDLELAADFVEHVTGHPPTPEEEADLLAAMAAAELAAVGEW
jgi:exonuclease SbcD